MTRVALSLWFNDELEISIRSLWSRLQSSGISSPLYDGRYRPHVTLGLWEIPNLPQLASALTNLLSTVSPFPIRFEYAGLFPGAEGVAFLAPIVTTSLLALHRSVTDCAAAYGQSASPYYQPGAWVPHCTAAWKVSAESALTVARMCLESGVLPLTGTVTHLGIIQTPEEVELARVGLWSAGIPAC